MRPQNRVLAVLTFLLTLTTAAFAQDADPKKPSEEGLRRIDMPSRHHQRNVDVEINNEALDASIEAAVSVALKSIDVALSGFNIQLEPLDINMPDIHIDLEPLNIHMPDIDIDLESLHIDIPDIDIDLEPLNLNVPEIDIEPIHVEVPKIAIDPKPVVKKID